MFGSNAGTRVVPVRERDGFYHPSTEAELVMLVEEALTRRVSLRVRGSAHSIPGAIYTDERLAGRIGAIDVKLDRYAAISFDADRMQVTVEAGCHLGDDPRDPSSSATWDRSLLAQLEARGWALPDLGGVTHQTVSGFFATGSSGGSVQHSIEDALVSIRFIDGRGRVHTVNRGDECFFALTCSMGLLGVVSRLTLQCIPRFDVIGYEDVALENDGLFDLVGEGEAGLGAFLRHTEYARLMWWPQPGLGRIATWQARRMLDEDYDATTGPRGNLRRRPYQAVVRGLPPALSRPLSTGAQALGGAFYDVLELARAGREKVQSRAPSIASAIEVGAMTLRDAVVPGVLRQFVPLDEAGPQRFCDSWCHGLPMDNQMSETSLPTTFTEIWVPLERTSEAMLTLTDLFRRGGLDATGNYIFEIYAARATSGWLHPGHGRDSLRIDIFWFERSGADHEAFFGRFWDALAELDYRLHWGKHLPSDARRGSEYLAKRFPRWNDFLALRAELDPEGIFLTQHFRRALGIEAPSIGEGKPLFARPAPAPFRVDVPISRRFRGLLEAAAIERPSALDRLSDVFTDDVEICDPFRTVRGLAAVRKLLETWLGRFDEVDFNTFRVTEGGDEFVLTYEMHALAGRGPTLAVPIVSICSVRDDRVHRVKSHYDVAAALSATSPAAAAVVHSLVTRFFL